MKESKGISKSTKIEEFSKEKELELRKGRIELAKFAGLMVTTFGAASALILSEDERVQVVGAIVFIGLLTYPVAGIGKQILREW